jgi:hypothetical protein
VRSVAGCPSLIFFILIGECWFFLNDQHSPIIKKIQSSKSWYLQIALILSIENPLPRGVVDKGVNTNPECAWDRAYSETFTQIEK